MRDLLQSDVQPEFTGVRVGDLRHSQADVSAACADLGFEARVSLRSGLATTIAYFREEGGAADPRRVTARGLR